MRFLDSCGNDPSCLSDQDRKRLDDLNEREVEWHSDERDLDARFNDLVARIAAGRPRYDVLNRLVQARNDVATAGNEADAKAAIRG